MTVSLYALVGLAGRPTRCSTSGRLHSQHSLLVILADKHDRASNNAVFLGALDPHASTTAPRRHYQDVMLQSNLLVSSLTNFAMACKSRLPVRGNRIWWRPSPPVATLRARARTGPEQHEETSTRS